MHDSNVIIAVDKRSVIKKKRENLCEANKAFRGFNRSELCTQFSRTAYIYLAMHIEWSI